MKRGGVAVAANEGTALSMHKSQAAQGLKRGVEDIPDPLARPERRTSQKRGSTQPLPALEEEAEGPTL